jgi:rhamnosyltransferase
MNAVFSQQTKYTYEVIVIDSGSKDGTLRILNKYPIKLFQIPPGDFNHGETRNLGANYSSNGVKYLVYLSQDATPIDDWLDNLIRPLEEDQKIAGAFSRQIPRKDCVPSIARLMTTEWIQLGTPERVVKKIEDLEEYERNKPFYAFFSNTSSCLRKSVWQKYPFSRIDFAEDAEWADRVLRAGYTLVYEPQSAVIHSHNYSLWQQLSQNFDHAKAMKEIFDPEAYRKGFPFRTFRIVLEQILRDFIYIKKLQAPAFKKLYWLLYTPLWHLATQAGSFLGSRYEGLPYILINFLSRQRRLKRR